MWIPKWLQRKKTERTPELFKYYKPMTRIELAELIQETLEAIGGAETVIQRAAARDLARQREVEQAVKDIKSGVS